MGREKEKQTWWLVDVYHTLKGADNKLSVALISFAKHGNLQGSGNSEGKHMSQGNMISGSSNSTNWSWCYRNVLWSPDGFGGGKKMYKHQVQNYHFVCGVNMWDLCGKLDTSAAPSSADPFKLIEEKNKILELKKVLLVPETFPFIPLIVFQIDPFLLENQHLSFYVLPYLRPI